MKHARILLFEDDPRVRDDIRFHLRNTNHEIIGEAATRARALELSGLLQSAGGYLLGNVVLLDANLDGRNGEDAHAIWHRLQKLQPRPETIGISANGLREHYGIWVSEAQDLTKDCLGRLPEVLDGLPEIAI